METLPKAAKLTLVQNIVVFGIARFIARTLLTICGRGTCRGARRFPRKGGVLILANHLSDVDPLMVQMSCPRNVHFMAKSELFEMKILGAMMRWGSTFPVKRGESDRGALRLAADYVKIGEVVCIFPEGQISEDATLQEIKPGVALIIRLAEANAICLGIKNTHCVMPYSKMTPRFSSKRVESLWGEARKFTKDDSTEEILSWIRENLTALSN